MMIRGFSIVGVCVTGLLFAVGCAGADASEGDTSAVQQAAQEPIEPPPGDVEQCVVACQRFDVTGAILGKCCVCNGALKHFAHSPVNPYLFWCR